MDTFYIDTICTLSTGYLPIRLIPPSQLNEMITQGKKTVTKRSIEFGVVIKRLHLYYDIKLVTFGIGGNLDLIIQFPVFVQPYSQSLLPLYQIEFVQAV